VTPATKYSTRTRIVAPAAALLAATIPVASHVAAQSDPIATRLVVLHAGVDTGKVEVHINNEKVIDEFEYLDQSDWFDLNPGSMRFTITADRTGLNHVVFDTTYPVPVGNDYYIVITDSLVLAGAFDTEGVPDGEARVQLLHASVDTPQAAVHVTGGDVDETVQVAYAGKTAGVAAPAGTYTVDVALSDSGESLLSTDLTVEAGGAYLAVVAGDPNSDDKPLTLAVLQTGVSPASATPVS
jgi:hypothetical protein